jgi:hypothetical protein
MYRMPLVMCKAVLIIPASHPTPPHLPKECPHFSCLTPYKLDLKKPMLLGHLAGPTTPLWCFFLFLSFNTVLLINVSLPSSRGSLFFWQCFSFLFPYYFFPFFPIKYCVFFTICVSVQVTPGLAVFWTNVFLNYSVQLQ